MATPFQYAQSASWYQCRILIPKIRVGKSDSDNLKVATVHAFLYLPFSAENTNYFLYRSLEKLRVSPGEYTRPDLLTIKNHLPYIISSSYKLLDLSSQIKHSVSWMEFFLNIS
jgi:hypothetical protein